MRKSGRRAGFAFILAGLMLHGAKSPAFCAAVAADSQRARDVAIMKAVCESDPEEIWSVTGKGRDLQCKNCPSYTGTSGPPTAELFSVLLGSFTGSGSEALAVLQGCEGHVNEFGGAVLLAQEQDSWSMIDYYPGLVLDASKCLAFKGADARTILVCLEDHQNQGYLYNWVEAIRYQDDASFERSTLVDRVVSDIGGADPCVDGSSWNTIKLTKDPAAQKGALFIAIESEKSRPDPKEKCVSSLSGPRAMIKSKKKFQLRYELHGEDFEPDPAFRDAFAAFEKYESGQ